MANAEALLVLVAKVGWQFLVFPWNEQSKLTKQEAMADKLGFKSLELLIKVPLLNDLDKNVVNKSKKIEKETGMALMTK